MGETSASDGHILVIKLGALGDFIQALGPMKAIRAHHPHSRITLLTTKPFAALAEASGYFNDIIIDQRPKFYQLRQWLSLRHQLNTGHYTRVYDLQNNDRTSFYFRLMTPKPEWIGVAPGASHRNTSPGRTAGLAFHGHRQTLSLAGIGTVDIDSLDWIQGRADYTGLTKPYVLLVPGSAPKRPEKRWPAESYAALATLLANRGYCPVLIGTAAEADILATIKDGCPSCLNLGGQTTLMDIAPLARAAVAAIGNDTGPMHMIAPTGIPSLVLFSGNSNPARHAPLGGRVTTLQKEDLKDLTPAEVWERLHLQLDGSL